jgi:hypothetical protein
MMDIIVYKYDDIAEGVILDRELIYYWDNGLANQHHSVEAVASALCRATGGTIREVLLGEEVDAETWNHDDLAEAAIQEIIRRNQNGRLV